MSVCALRVTGTREFPPSALTGKLATFKLIVAIESVKSNFAHACYPGRQRIIRLA